MRAGQLRTLITLQSKSVTGRDADGGEIISWGTFSQDWADVQPLQLRELLTAKVAGSEVNMRVLMRYRTGVTSDMRVLIDGTAYAIVAPPVDVEFRHVTLELLCGGPSVAT